MGTVACHQSPCLVGIFCTGILYPGSQSSWAPGCPCSANISSILPTNKGQSLIEGSWQPQGARLFLPFLFVAVPENLVSFLLLYLETIDFHCKKNKRMHVGDEHMDSTQ